MSKQIEAMKLALEALEEVQGHMNTSDWFNERVDALRVAIASYSTAINAAELREESAVAEPHMKQSAERVEPVAWGNLANWCLDSDRVLITDKTKAEEYHRDVYDLTPLYTTPPYVATPLAAQREWQGLTDEEIEDVWASCEPDWDDKVNVLTIARAIEAKLREKNSL
jgi:hypothetical protein